MLSLDQKSFELFIDGSFTEAADGGTFETVDPATGQVIGHVAKATETDVDAAVASAQDCFEDGWGALDAYKRGRLLEAWASTLWESRDRISEIESRDQGKTVREARADVAFAIKTLEYYAGLADKIEGEEIPVPGDRVTFTTREPLGVTAHVSPWNYPFQLAMRSLAPALAAGNTAVLKPATWTPISSLAMAETAAEAGLPEGTLNVIPGSGSVAGKALTEHDDVRAIAFTGSTDTGLMIGQTAAQRAVPSTLEMGGKCPNIVFDDANLKAASKGAVFGAFLNAGQMCWAGSRLLVQEDIADDFVSNLGSYVGNKLTVGPGTADGSRMGPLVHEDHMADVEAYFEVAEDEGATLVTGGARAEGDGLEGGNFLEPTIYKDVDPDGRLAQEEIFGPILSVMTFSDEDEALELANNTRYGLYAGVWTTDLGRAMRTAKGIEAGQVTVNEYPITFPQAPFGGFKESGVGHEQGQGAIEHYTKLKTVFVNHG